MRQAELLDATGAAFIILGSERLGINLSPFPKPVAGCMLVQDGIFALVRHSIYTGFIIFTFAWSLLWRSLADDPFVY